MNPIPKISPMSARLANCRRAASRSAPGPGSRDSKVIPSSFFSLSRAPIGRVVERLVSPAPHIEDKADGQRGGRLFLVVLFPAPSSEQTEEREQQYRTGPEPSYCVCSDLHGFTSLSPFRFRRRHETLAATGFVHIACSHNHQLLLLGDSLSSVGGIAADHADRKSLRYILSQGEQLGHRPERPPPVVLVEPRDDDPLPRVRKSFTNFNQARLEELGFIHPDDLSLPA